MSNDNLMFTATEHGQAMHAKVKAFIETNIEPIEAQFWKIVIRKTLMAIGKTGIGQKPTKTYASKHVKRLVEFILAR